MSVTLFGLIAAAAPVALDAISNYVRENRGIVNGLLKESKPILRDAPQLLDNELHKHENDGWSKDK